MDPNAALNRLNDALDDGDFEGAVDAAGALVEWIEKGGLLPDDRDGLTKLLRLVRDVAQASLDGNDEDGDGDEG